MASKSELDRRRKEMCNWVFRGIPPSSAADRLAKKYNVAASTIRSDWSNRTDWLPELFDISQDKTNQMIFDILAEQKTLKNQLWQLQTNSNQDNIRLGALKELGKMNKDLLNFIIETGFIDKQPDKLELSGKDGGAIEFTESSAKELLASKLDSIAASTKE